MYSLVLNRGLQLSAAAGHNAHESSGSLKLEDKKPKHWAETCSEAEELKVIPFISHLSFFINIVVSAFKTKYRLQMFRLTPSVQNESFLFHSIQFFARNEYCCNCPNVAMSTHGWWCGLDTHKL